RAQTPQRALGGDMADVIRGFETGDAARHGNPVITLHGIPFARHRDRGERARARAVFPGETVRIRKYAPPRMRSERSAIGVGDTRIGFERGGFGPSRELDLVGCFELLD